MADTELTRSSKFGIPGTTPMNLTCAAAAAAAGAATTSTSNDTTTYSALYVAIDTTGNTPAPPSGSGWQRVVGPGANGKYNITFNGQSLEANGPGVIVYGKP